eukprot:Platyproteum_vivax@DN16240_c0_g1_i1.p1
MGGDGGSIPKRIDLVREKGQAYIRNLGGMGYTPNTIIHLHDETVDPQKARMTRWTTCALSQEALRDPIVACKLGFLYNKEAVLTQMAAKTLPHNCRHIQTLRDIKDCKLEVNKETGKYMCPITLEELTGTAKAWLNWNCSCVTSERILKNINTKGKVAECLACGKVYQNEDVIQLIQSTEQVEKRRQAIDEVLSKKKRKKKEPVPVEIMANAPVKKSKTTELPKQTSSVYQSLFKTNPEKRGTIFSSTKL